jgi:flagellar biosynthesis chaperone FliJ
MGKIPHLKKFGYILEKQKSHLYKKCALSKKKLDEELRKFNLLDSYINEYQANINKLSENSIHSYQYQQYQQFLQQVQKAVNQQTEVLKNQYAMHTNLVNQYEAINNKLKLLDKLITKETLKIEYQINKRENQTNTELYNQSKRAEND